MNEFMSDIKADAVEEVSVDPDLFDYRYELIQSINLEATNHEFISNQTKPYEIVRSYCIISYRILTLSILTLSFWTLSILMLSILM